MTAQELEDRIVEAEKTPALIRPLIADFKADKDAQLSDLTAQVNTLTPALDTKQAELDAAEAKRLADIAAKQAEVDAEKARADAERLAKEELLKPEKQKRIEALEAQDAAIRAEIEKLQADVGAVSAEPVIAIK